MKKKSYIEIALITLCILSIFSAILYEYYITTDISFLNFSDVNHNKIHHRGKDIYFSDIQIILFYIQPIIFLSPIVIFTIWKLRQKAKR